MKLRVLALIAIAACNAEPTISMLPNTPPGTPPPSDPNNPSDPNDPNNPSNPTDPNDPTNPRVNLPCDVATVLAAKCQSCHAATPRYGAPMPLMTYADTQAPSKSDPNRKVYELIGDRIVNEARPMPPVEELTNTERVALYGWLGAGAPSGNACTTEPNPVTPPAMPGPETLPCTPSHTFKAHGASAESRFEVPEQSNLYQCFTFRSPFGPNTRGTAWAPITDDDRVLHHWILYRTKTAQVDGGSQACQMPGDATFVAGWAPGGNNFVMPPDVDLELPGPDDWLILQVHYHNSAGYTDAADASGVAFCTSEQPRTHTAGFYTLGSVRIDIPANAAEHSVTGECPSWATRYLPEPINVLASFPHMHRLGRRLTTDVFRGGESGARETIVEVSHFDFENQMMYPSEPVFEVRPGDMLRTTCTYSNTTGDRVRFGERTEDEMCFNFLMIYPISIFRDARQCGLL